ncbi:MAG TPA: hypothetical protein VIV60_11785, partial [Polyangiaceae bacterium]
MTRGHQRRIEREISGAFELKDAQRRERCHGSMILRHLARVSSKRVPLRQRCTTATETKCRV